MQLCSRRSHRRGGLYPGAHPVLPFTLQYLFTMLAGLLLGPRLGHHLHRGPICCGGWRGLPILYRGRWAVVCVQAQLWLYHRLLRRDLCHRSAGQRAEKAHGAGLSGGQLRPGWRWSMWWAMGLITISSATMSLASPIGLWPLIPCIAASGHPGDIAPEHPGGLSWSSGCSPCWGRTCAPRPEKLDFCLILRRSILLMDVLALAQEIINGSAAGPPGRSVLLCSYL